MQANEQRERTSAGCDFVNPEAHVPRGLGRVHTRSVHHGGLPVLFIGDGVTEIWLDLSRERLIRVVGHDRNGRKTERHLKITGKGRMVLV